MQDITYVYKHPYIHKHIHAYSYTYTHIYCTMYALHRNGSMSGGSGSLFCWATCADSKSHGQPAQPVADAFVSF